MQNDHFWSSCAREKGAQASLCGAFEKIVSNDDHELWSMIAARISVDENCVRVFSNHNNPELWSLLLGKEHDGRLSLLITDRIASISTKGMQLLARHFEHELIDKYVLENDRFLSTRIEHCKRYDLDLSDVLLRPDLDEDCLLALAPHFSSNIEAVAPNLPCYHELMSKLIQICENDSIKNHRTLSCTPRT